MGKTKRKRKNLEKNTHNHRRKNKHHKRSKHNTKQQKRQPRTTKPNQRHQKTLQHKRSISRQSIPIKRKPKPHTPIRSNTIHTLQNKHQQKKKHTKHMGKNVQILHKPPRRIRIPLPQKKQRRNNIPHDKNKIRLTPTLKNKQRTRKRNTSKMPMPQHLRTNTRNIRTKNTNRLPKMCKTTTCTKIGYLNVQSR